MKFTDRSFGKRLKASLSRGKSETGTSTETENASDTIDESTASQRVEESTQPASDRDVGLETEHEVNEEPLQAEALKALCLKYRIYPVPETAERTDHTNDYIMFEDIEPDGGVHIHKVVHGDLYMYNRKQAYSPEFHDCIVEKNGTDRPTICRSFTDRTDYYRLRLDPNLGSSRRAPTTYLGSLIRPPDNTDSWEKIARTQPLKTLNYGQLGRGILG